MTVHQIALFGAGRIGHVHATSVAHNRRSRLKHVVDITGACAENLAAEFDANVVTPEAAMGDPDVSAIIIASSTDTHVDLIVKGCAAGKHVFCEKPIDLDIARVDACLKQIEGARSKLFVAFNRRFDLHFGELRRRVVAGEVGDLELLTIVSKDPGPPPVEYQRVAGGLIRDMMIHDIDLARFILREEPVRVHATAAALFDPIARSLDDVDTAVLTLQTARGTIATITNSRRATYGYDQRIEAHGSMGMLRAGNVYENHVHLANGDGITGSRVKHFFLERYEYAYRAEWAAFLDSIDGDTLPEPTGLDGQRALMIANAGYESLSSGRSVDLSW